MRRVDGGGDSLHRNRNRNPKSCECSFVLKSESSDSYRENIGMVANVRTLNDQKGKKKVREIGRAHV